MGFNVKGDINVLKPENKENQFPLVTEVMINDSVFRWPLKNWVKNDFIFDTTYELYKILTW